METLNSLNELIKNQREVLGIARTDYIVWIEQGVIEPGSLKEDERGLHFCDYRYRLALAIDAMHEHRGGILLAMLHNWDQSLPEKVRKGLGPIDIVTESRTLQGNKGRVLSVEATMEVKDGIHLTEDDQGPVLALGRRWKFGEHDTGYAQSASLDMRGR